jgi:hypothetical protein
MFNEGASCFHDTSSDPHFPFKVGRAQAPWSIGVLARLHRGIRCIYPRASFIKYPHICTYVSHYLTEGMSELLTSKKFSGSAIVTPSLLTQIFFFLILPFPSASIPPHRSCWPIRQAPHTVPQRAKALRRNQTIKDSIAS